MPENSDSGQHDPPEGSLDPLPANGEGGATTTLTPFELIDSFRRRRRVLAALVGFAVLVVLAGLVVLPVVLLDRGSNVEEIDAFACPGDTDQIGSVPSDARPTAIDETADWIRVLLPGETNEVWVRRADSEREYAGLLLGSCAPDPEPTPEPSARPTPTSTPVPTPTAEPTSTPTPRPRPAAPAPLSPPAQGG